MKWSAPERMSPSDRLAELGELLATGAMRFLARRIKPNRSAKISQDQLDAIAKVEASCGTAMDSHA